MTEVTEEWRDVPGYEGLYQVSNLGRVMALPRLKMCGSSVRWTSFRLLKQQPLPAGHKIVGLYNELGLCVKSRVHCLVLLAFVGPCPKGMECRHFPDRDPQNNRLENLQWGTRVQNMEDKKVHGTDDRGSKSVNAKLTEADVIEMRQRYANGESQGSLSKRFGIGQSRISFIVNRKAWTHV